MEREPGLKKEEHSSFSGMKKSKDELEKPEPSRNNNVNQDSIWAFFKELIVLVGTALILAWIIKSFLIQPFYIPSSSMEKTLMPNDRVLVNKVVYLLRPPKRQEIVVFNSPHEQSKDLIKRIIGIGGDELEIKGGVVYINGNKVIEDYINKEGNQQNYGPIKIPKGSLFVMGDNRPYSQDSRFFGVISEEDIIGKSFIIYWPISRISLIGK